MDLIGAGKLEDAIKVMLPHFEKSSDKEQYHSLILQSARYRENENDRINHLISLEDYRRTKAQIGHALQYIAEELPEMENERHKDTDRTSHENSQTSHISIFISYNHGDRVEADRIKIKLKDAGFRVLIDVETVKPDENIYQFIKDKVKESDFTLSVISKKSLKSSWVALETIYSWYSEDLTDRKFLPCLLDKAIFDTTFSREAFGHIDKKLDELNKEIQFLASIHAGTVNLETERDRYLELRQKLPSILNRLEQSYCVDVSGDRFESGMQEILDFVTKSRT